MLHNIDRLQIDHSGCDQFVYDRVLFFTFLKKVLCAL